MKPEIKTELTQYLEGLMKILGESPVIEFKNESDREILVNLKGLQSIDGSDPKPLRSLSYLAEISMRRKTGKGIKIHLDANGMQEQRLNDLRALAKSTAQRVIVTLSRIELPPMETQDRKLVHEILSEIDGVKTHSEGQGDERRVIVEPMSHIKAQRQDDVQNPQEDRNQESDQDSNSDSQSDNESLI